LKNVLARITLPAKRLCVIARSEATRQSSAREARQNKKRCSRGNLSAYFACLPARSWIASLRSQRRIMLSQIVMPGRHFFTARR
jgi:hypothetical protein